MIMIGALNEFSLETSLEEDLELLENFKLSKTEQL